MGGLKGNVNPIFWKDKRVFLTGHTGFKGSWLSLWLQTMGAIIKGYALEPPTNPSLFLEANVANGMESEIGDIRELAILKKSMTDFNPDILIHMAAQPLVRLSYLEPVETYTTNVNPNKIRILGTSNGAGLANRIFIENTNPGIDIVCAVVSHLNDFQYHLGDFYKPSSVSDPISSYCGYDVVSNPLSSRKYLSISNTNDNLIPYNGGFSPNIGATFLPAETASHIIATHKGYTGSILTSGTTIVLTTVIGNFVAGEKLIASDSAETGGLIENAANADITISAGTGSIVSKRFSDVRSFFMDDADGDQDFMSIVAQTFLEEIPPDLEGLTEAIKSNNKELAYQFAHKMKPNFEMLGIAVQKDVKSIESWTKSSRSEATVQENIDTLNRVLSHVFEELKTDFPT